MQKFERNKRRVQKDGALALWMGERSKRMDRLIIFAEEHKQIIANIVFQKPKGIGRGSHQTEKQKQRQQQNRQILPCLTKVQ